VKKVVLVLCVVLPLVLLVGCASNNAKVAPALLDRLDVIAAEREAAGDKEEADTIRAVSAAARAPGGVDALTLIMVAQKLNVKGQATVIMGESHIGPFYWNATGTTASLMFSINPELAQYDLVKQKEDIAPGVTDKTSGG
jgi:hypothetical protein